MGGVDRRFVWGAPPWGNVGPPILWRKVGEWGAYSALFHPILSKSIQVDPIPQYSIEFRPIVNALLQLQLALSIFVGLAFCLYKPFGPGFLFPYYLSHGH